MDGPIAASDEDRLAHVSNTVTMLNRLAQHNSWYNSPETAGTAH
jgi:hypothetical protein